MVFELITVKKYKIAKSCHVVCRLKMDNCLSVVHMYLTAMSNVSGIHWDGVVLSNGSNHNSHKLITRLHTHAISPFCLLDVACLVCDQGKTKDHVPERVLRGKCLVFFLKHEHM